MLSPEALRAVIPERYKAQRLIAVHVADSMNAAALGEDHAAGLDLPLPHVMLRQSEDLDVAQGVLRVVRQIRVVAIAHVRDSLPFEDVIQLLAADVLMGAFDRAGRNRDLVEPDVGAAEFALHGPAHLDGVVVLSRTSEAPRRGSGHP